MKVQHVPLEWVNQVWPQVEGFIESAMAHSGGEYTVDQVRTLVTSGQWTLVIAVDEEGIKGAATIMFFNRPNDRVAFVTAIGGKLISTPDTFNDLKAIAASFGATAIEGAARKSIARLWRKLYNFQEKYTIVGVKL
jgi:hypothetical protein